MFEVASDKKFVKKKLFEAASNNEFAKKCHEWLTAKCKASKTLKRFINILDTVVPRTNEVTDIEAFRIFAGLENEKSKSVNAYSFNVYTTIE